MLPLTTTLMPIDNHMAVVDAEVAEVAEDAMAEEEAVVAVAMVDDTEVEALINKMKLIMCTMKKVEKIMVFLKMKIMIIVITPMFTAILHNVITYHLLNV